jgi:hypothetical protein
MVEEIFERLKNVGLTRAAVNHDKKLGWVLSCRGFFVASFMHEDDANLIAELINHG